MKITICLWLLFLSVTFAFAQSPPLPPEPSETWTNQFVDRTLEADPSPDVGIETYRVYWTTNAQDALPFSEWTLMSTNMQATVTNVPYGSATRYYATAISTNGLESLPSNIVTNTPAEDAPRPPSLKLMIMVQPIFEGSDDMQEWKEIARGPEVVFVPRSDIGHTRVRLDYRTILATP